MPQLDRWGRMQASLVIILCLIAWVGPALLYAPAPRAYRPELLLSGEVQLLMRADSPIPNYEERVRKAVTDDDVLQLGRCMNSKNPSVQLGAAQLLGIVGTRGKRGIAGLLRGLEARDDFVREGSARALGRIGEFPEHAVPAITRLLDDKSVGVRKSAAEALARFGDRSSR